MLKWLSPFPLYPATYIFKVFPREKTVPACPTNYWTTFFWGNNGTFIWDNGNGNTYYGAHPYPDPPPSGPQYWEVSVFSHDEHAVGEVGWDRWYQQAFVAYKVGAQAEHDFYYDLPDINKIVQSVDGQQAGDWADSNPPAPAIVMGQAPDLNGQSWGGYPGWEEFKGIIRGIQIYSVKLSTADIAQEIISPLSTVSGASNIWYLNLDPHPGDVSDHSGQGHNPTWEGVPAIGWNFSSCIAKCAQGSVSMIWDHDTGIWSGITIEASADLKVKMSVGGNSIDQVYNAGTTTTNFGTPVSLSLTTNWKGNTYLTAGGLVYSISGA